MFHYAELHLGLEGTLYILSAVIASGILFGSFFLPLKQKPEDLNGNKTVSFSHETEVNEPHKLSTKAKDEEEETTLKDYFKSLQSVPMCLLMLSHLLMHFGIGLK